MKLEVSLHRVCTGLQSAIWMSSRMGFAMRVARIPKDFRAEEQRGGSHIVQLEMTLD